MNLHRDDGLRPEDDGFLEAFRRHAGLDEDAE